MYICRASLFCTLERHPTWVVTVLLASEALPYASPEIICLASRANALHQSYRPTAPKNFGKPNEPTDKLWHARQKKQSSNLTKNIYYPARIKASLASKESPPPPRHWNKQFLLVERTRSAWQCTSLESYFVGKGSWLRCQYQRIPVPAFAGTVSFPQMELQGCVVSSCPCAGCFDTPCANLKFKAATLPIILAQPPSLSRSFRRHKLDRPSALTIKKYT